MILSTMRVRVIFQFFAIENSIMQSLSKKKVGSEKKWRIDFLWGIKVLVKSEKPERSNWEVEKLIFHPGNDELFVTCLKFCTRKCLGPIFRNLYSEFRNEKLIPHFLKLKTRKKNEFSLKK